MKLTVNPLSPSSVRDAAAAILKYRDSLHDKCERFVKELSARGIEIARTVFGEATYDIDYYSGLSEDTNISVNIEDAEDNGDHGFGCRIVANGEEVCFVEFGAGVYFNSGGDSQHEVRPEGIVGIGEYGMGHGKEDNWWYNDSAGKSHRTHGTMEQPGMALAAKIMRDQIFEVAREVFGSD